MLSAILLKKKDRVIYFQASQPDSINMFVTALDDDAGIPRCEIVMEHQLCEETLGFTLLYLRDSRIYTPIFKNGRNSTCSRNKDGERR